MAHEKKDDLKYIIEAEKIIDRYLRKGSFGKLQEDFDAFYYNHENKPDDALVEFMGQLSLTTSDYNEYSNPSSAGMIYEPNFREYAKIFLVRLREKIVQLSKDK